MREKRMCANINHPFTQEWYWYGGTHDDPNYCSSCAIYLRALRAMLDAVTLPQKTLYGDKIIGTDRHQAKSIIFEIFNEREARKLEVEP